MRGVNPKAGFTLSIFPGGHNEPAPSTPVSLLFALRTRRRALEADTPPHAFNKSESIVEPVWSPQTQHYVRNVAVLTYRRLPRKNGCSKIFSSIVQMSRLLWLESRWLRRTGGNLGDCNRYYR